MATTVSQHQIAAFTGPQNGDALDATVVLGNDNGVRDAYVAHDADTGIHVQSSILSSRPSAGTAGRKWMTTDSGVRLWYDTGSVWEEAAYASTVAAVTFADNVTIDGNTVLGSSSADTITVNGKLINDLVPNATNSYDLGVTGTRWRNLFLSGAATITGTVTAGTFSGSGASLTSLPAGNLTGSLPAISGASLTSLNASNLGSGTVPDARFPATLPALNGSNLTNIAAANVVAGSLGSGNFTVTGNLTVTGNVSAASISGPTTVNASNVSAGTFPSGTWAFSSGFSVTGNVSVSGSMTASSFSGDGSSLTNITAASISAGTFPAGTYAFASSSAVTVNGTLTATGAITAASFSGSGASLTSIPAAAINAGSFGTGNFTITGNLTATGNVTASSGTITANAFSGGGASITSLSASNVSSGTLNEARLPGTYANATTFSNEVTFSRSTNSAIKFTAGGYLNFATTTGTPYAMKIVDEITDYGLIPQANAGWADDTPSANGLCRFIRINVTGLTGTTKTEGWIPVWVET